MTGGGEGGGGGVCSPQSFSEIHAYWCCISGGDNRKT